MDPEQFHRLRESFERLLAASPEQRTAILEKQAETDPQIANELSHMLTAYSRISSVLDHPVVPTPKNGLSLEGGQIGPYRIEKQLGAGGMGLVYLATRADGSFQRRVAIKILRHDLVDRSFLTRFQQERRILAQLNHPHIASILDAGETADGNPYFVMEYVDGVPITEYCEKHDLPVSGRLDLFLQVCDAVQHAHRNLTVHRDLKPANVLVTEAGAVKLLDFGIAKLLEPEPFQPADPAPSAVILTPEYSSPEQIRKDPVTTATDVFALGILLYEILSGTHPFRGNGRLPHEVMRAICEDDPPPPSAAAKPHGKQLRGDLDTIVLTALRKQASWRYLSVEQLAEDVRRHQRGWPILAKGNRRWYRAGKFVRRQWLPLTAAALLLISLTAGVIATTYQAHIADRARIAAERATARAEAERATAEHERMLAQQAQKAAVEQKGVAETRTREAEVERSRERERYRDVRSLASSLLFDLYDGVRDLAGSTTARRLIVAKARRQLEVLSADGSKDIGLQRDLAACYERMGELQVDPTRPDKNDAAAALDSYQKAVDLRSKIVQLPGATPQDSGDLALSLAKLGEGQFRAGNPKGSVATYQKSWEIAQSQLQSAPGDALRQRSLGTIDERRCIILFAAGNTAGALQACQEGIDTLTPLAAKSPDEIDVHRLIASTEASYANALRLSQKPKDAEQHARRAVDSLARLEVLAPNNAEYRRMAASAEVILGSVLASSDIGASQEAFRRAVESMKIALEIDPGDLSGALRLGVTLLAFSGRLSAAGNQDGAQRAAVDALQMLGQTAEKPTAGAVEWNEYANALLKVPLPTLRQPAKALELAERSVAATGRRNPFFLDTLAWAWYRNGQSDKAAEVEKEALALLPPTSTGGLHDELSAALKTFLDAQKL